MAHKNVCHETLKYEEKLWFCLKLNPESSLQKGEDFILEVYNRKRMETSKPEALVWFVQATFR